MPIAPNLSVFHVLIKSDAAAAAAPLQNQKMFKIGAVYVVRSLHTHFEPNQTILAMFCTQPAKSPHLSTPPYISDQRLHTQPLVQCLESNDFYYLCQN